MLGLPDVPWNGLLKDMVGKDRVGKLRVVVTTFLSLQTKEKITFLSNPVIFCQIASKEFLKYASLK